jgi:hypothetical protein
MDKIPSGAIHRLAGSATRGTAIAIAYAFAQNRWHLTDGLIST